MKRELTWPSGIANPKEQIYLFFDSVNRILQDLPKNERELHNKSIAKIVMSKLPKSLKITSEKLVGLPKLKDLSTLKKYILERRFVLENPGSEETETDISNSQQQVRSCTFCRLDHEDEACPKLRAIVVNFATLAGNMSGQSTKPKNKRQSQSLKFLAS